MGRSNGDQCYTYTDIESYINITGAIIDKEESQLLHELSKQYVYDVARFSGKDGDKLESSKKDGGYSAFMAMAVSR